MHKSERKKLPRTDSDVAFCYHQELEAIVRDLKNIDSLIPVESSRHGCLVKSIEAQAIIEARKNDLLGYVQTICRDHILWSNRLLNRGWTAKQWIESQKKGRK